MRRIDTPHHEAECDQINNAQTEFARPNLPAPIHRAVLPASPLLSRLAEARILLGLYPVAKIRFAESLIIANNCAIRPAWLYFLLPVKSPALKR
jgi:hypothetical protein